MKLTLKDIAITIWRSILVIIISSFLGAALFAGVTWLFVKPEYTATAKLYVYNENNSETFTSSDLAVSKSLVDTYLIIIESDPILTKVQSDLKTKYPELTVDDMLEMLSGSAINDTEAFYISAVSEDRQLATDIIADIVRVAPDEIIRIVKAASVEVIEDVKLPEGDDYEWPLVSNTIIGFALGFILSILYVLVSNALDTVIYGRNEIENAFTIPVVGSIPVHESTESSRRKRRDFSGQLVQSCILSSNTPFGVEEAYRKARSNIIYLPSAKDENCKTLVITSALASEGKSTFSVNLSISLARSGKKVLLIDADMRKPRISRYLNVEEQEGLSEYLAKITKEIKPVEYTKGLDLLVSGKRNSYAAELLSTERITKLLEKYKKDYDYIIIDTPPINEVSDAMTLVEKVDGYIMCTIAGYSDTGQIKNAVSALEQIGGKIFGFVIIGVDPDEEQYGRYKRYGKYGRRYYKYGRDYVYSRRFGKYYYSYDKKKNYSYDAKRIIAVDKNVAGGLSDQRPATNGLATSDLADQKLATNDSTASDLIAKNSVAGDSEIKD